MIEVNLITALQRFLESVVKDYDLPAVAGDGTWKAPAVINSYLPVTQDDSDDNPFVLVRAESGSAGQETISIKVAIIVGCHDPDQKQGGYNWALDIIARIRTALMGMENQVLKDIDGRPRYQFIPEVTWENVSDQTWPYFQLQMMTSWQLRSPQPPAIDF